MTTTFFSDFADVVGGYRLRGNDVESFNIVKKNIERPLTVNLSYAITKTYDRWLKGVNSSMFLY